MNRRDFLKISAAITGAGLIPLKLVANADTGERDQIFIRLTTDRGSLLYKVPYRVETNAKKISIHAVEHLQMEVVDGFWFNKLECLIPHPIRTWADIPIPAAPCYISPGTLTIQWASEGLMVIT